MDQNLQRLMFEEWNAANAAAREEYDRLRADQETCRKGLHWMTEDNVEYGNDGARRCYRCRLTGNAERMRRVRADRRAEVA